MNINNVCNVITKSNNRKGHKRARIELLANSNLMIVLPNGDELNVYSGTDGDYCSIGIEGKSFNEVEPPTLEHDESTVRVAKVGKDNETVRVVKSKSFELRNGVGYFNRTSIEMSTVDIADEGKVNRERHTLHGDVNEVSYA